MYGKAAGTWERGKEMEGNKGNIKHPPWETLSNVEVGLGHAGKSVIAYVTSH